MTNVPEAGTRARLAPVPPLRRRTRLVAPPVASRPILPVPNRLRIAANTAPQRCPGKPARRRIERASKCERNLWAKMVTARDAGRRGFLKRLINIYITSYDVRLTCVHQANLKCKKCRRLPLRDLAAIAHNVNLLRPCAEPVNTFRVPKDDGGVREISVPTITNKARSKILASVLKLARDQVPGNAYYTGNGGRSAAVERVTELVADRDNKWLVEQDIVDFFGSFDEAAVVEMLQDLLPIDPRAVVYTALASQMNYPSESRRGRQGGRSNFLRTRKRSHTTRTRRQTGIVPHPFGSPVHINTESTKVTPTAGKDRCGLPQGFPASPLIAELLVTPSLAGRAVIYADNVIDTFATLAEVRENDKALVAVLADHRAGPFQLKTPTIRRLDWGADVLGTHIRKKQGTVTTGPTEAALARFYRETWLKPAEARKAGGKLNKAKLTKKGRGMARAMPVDAEAQAWLELAAEYRPRLLAGWRPEEVRVRNRELRMHYDLLYYGLAA